MRVFETLKRYSRAIVAAGLIVTSGAAAAYACSGTKYFDTGTSILKCTYIATINGDCYMSCQEYVKKP